MSEQDNRWTQAAKEILAGGTVKTLISVVLG
ncbi:MAG: hypothetical protein RLZZ579_739, partial [Actinomycetota bacterium]